MSNYSGCDGCVFHFIVKKVVHHCSNEIGLQHGADVKLMRMRKASATAPEHGAPKMQAMNIASAS